MTHRSRAGNRAIQRIAAWLLDELRRGSHEVVLVPPAEVRHSGHKIRALQSSNAVWYSKFAAQFVNCRGTGRKRMRRPRTYIKKVHVDRALERMAGGDFRGVMAERLVQFIETERSNARNRRRQKRSDDRENVDWSAIGILF